MRILLGNSAPIAANLGFADVTHPEEVEAIMQDAGNVPRDTVTVFEVPDVDDLVGEVLPTIVKTWSASHSSENPTWVASNNDGAAALLASNYNCPVKDIDEAWAEYVAIVNPQPVDDQEGEVVS